MNTGHPDNHAGGPMLSSTAAMVGVATLFLLSLSCVADPSAGLKQSEMPLRLVFERVEGKKYFFSLENDTSKPVSLLVYDFFALDTAVDCRSIHSVSRASTLFALRDPVAPNQTLPDTNVAPGTRLEIRVAPPILSESVNLLTKFKGGRCRVRIQLHQPEEVLESNEFEP